MSTLPHVFVDASCQPNSTTIGVYSRHLSISYSMTVNKSLTSYQGELLALKVAINLTKGTRCHYFTDNLQLANSQPFNVTWIPREFNQAADKLSKRKPNNQRKPNNLGTISIANYIQQTYSLKRKLKLIAVLRNIKSASISKLISDKMARRLLTSLLTKEERPTEYKKILADALPIKQQELLRMIRTYQNSSIAKV